MKKTIGRFRAPANPSATSVQKSVKSFTLLYTYPKCPEPKLIRGRKFIQYMFFLLFMVYLIELSQKNVDIDLVDH